MFRCAYFYAAICKQGPLAGVRVWATDVVRSARHPSGRCPLEQPEAFPAVFEQKHRKFPPDSQTSFLHTLLALPLLLLPLEGLSLMSGLLVFSFQVFANLQPAEGRQVLSTYERLKRLLVTKSLAQKQSGLHIYGSSCANYPSFESIIALLCLFMNF